VIIKQTSVDTELLYPNTHLPVTEVQTDIGVYSFTDQLYICTTCYTSTIGVHMAICIIREWWQRYWLRTTWNML